ncbi:MULTISPECIES: DUF4232 domain-containing protein [Streptomyces]|uniref:DUF4232 domain-containing protein n=1 Tax=Streptomyces dengpaensis TaxID=2049881 RepID=A0ABN5IBX1_9ACTN|nr:MULTISPECIES: DUF4232 domain-containing protein [Streptomyces]AVH60489.1 DUF4232 domain-containing protein [Streptomyces dengpaensis]PIB07591.1 Tat pathway signal sequence domain protein [Streptomyces sp. HG99]
MRVRTVLALSTAATALLLAVPQSGSAAPRPAKATGQPAKCAEKALELRAKQSADPTVVRISVTNRAGRACTVDRIPTVTFGDLDGAALPTPAGESGPYRLGAGRTAYAAVRTIADQADPQARRVDSITVSADPALYGRSFTAREVGAGGAVLVWEPVTTWWKPSVAAADKALGLS